MNIFQGETNRLFLSPPSMEYLDDLYRIQSNEEVMKYVGDGNVLSKEETEFYLQRHIQHYNDHGFSFGNIFEKESGLLVGFGGVMFLDYKSSNNEIEVGLLFARNVFGKGYGREAARYFLRWGFKNQEVEQIVAVTMPGNKMVDHSLRRMGMQREGTYVSEDDGIEYLLYNLTKENFELKNGTKVT